MVVARSTDYHARVFHHHPWRAADSTVYKSSKLITISAAVFPYKKIGGMLHISVHTTCFRVLGVATTGTHSKQQRQHTAPRAYCTSHSSSRQWK